MFISECLDAYLPDGRRGDTGHEEMEQRGPQRGPQFVVWPLTYLFRGCYKGAIVAMCSADMQAQWRWMEGE